MVGVGAGTSSDNGFVPYIIAITFHQFFDGCGEFHQLADQTHQSLERVLCLLAVCSLLRM